MLSANDKKSGGYMYTFSIYAGKRSGYVHNNKRVHAMATGAATAAGAGGVGGIYVGAEHGYGDDSDNDGDTLVNEGALMKSLRPLYEDIENHAYYHIITQDNWFNSWAVAEGMHKMKIYVRGTIRSGRCAPTVGKTKKHNTVGTERHLYYYNEDTDMTATITAIRDSSNVVFITSVPGDTQKDKWDDKLHAAHNAKQAKML